MDRKYLKQVIYRLLRIPYLLSFIDYLMFMNNRRKHLLPNRRLKLNRPEAKAPPASILYDALHCCNLDGYFKSGTVDAKLILDIVRRHKPGERIAILEWGCGPARVIQHLAKQDSNLGRVIRTDYNGETIRWCSTNFPDIEFCQNDLAPPLPIAPNSVDVVYAISVFTHLSEPMHHAWVNEVLRVLKPGGLLIATLHGEKKVEYLLPSEIAKFNDGMIVIRNKVREGKKHFLAFQSEKFVREKMFAKLHGSIASTMQGCTRTFGLPSRRKPHSQITAPMLRVLRM